MIVSNHVSYIYRPEKIRRWHTGLVFAHIKDELVIWLFGLWGILGGV